MREKEPRRTAAIPQEMKLFNGEKLLVLTGLIGFVLAAAIAVYIAIYGPVILPEGDAEKAFSFNAALGMFILSIAAVMPVAGLKQRSRSVIRWFFIGGTLLAYALETVQNFRGQQPRFSNSSHLFDIVSGIVFGLDSILLIIVTMLLAVPFFRKKQLEQRPLLVLSIRYSFLSVLIAFASGIWMVILQGRYTGSAGNIIVLHGLAFHALQALPLLGWLLERLQPVKPAVRKLVHTGGIAWTMSIIFVGIQTFFGRSVFELSPLSLLALAALLICLAAIGTALLSIPAFLRQTGRIIPRHSTNQMTK